MEYIRIGLTGGPGCGKSEAGRIFSSFQQWHCYDADQICHEIYKEPDSPFIKLLTAHWGTSILDNCGLPDRNAIAEKIFADEKERQWLNSVIQPEILFRLENRIARTDARFILIEVPLLFESKWHPGMDKTIAVWSPPEIQMARLLERGWTVEHAKRRMDAQLSAREKLELADYGIINRGSLEQLRDQCCRIASDIRNNYHK